MRVESGNPRPLRRWGTMTGGRIKKRSRKTILIAPRRSNRRRLKGGAVLKDDNGAKDFFQVSEVEPLIELLKILKE